MARIAVGGPTLFRSLGADGLRAPTSPMLRVQSVATSGAGPPVPRISVAAASSALLGKRIAGVQALPEAMLAGPPKRVRAQEPTTAAAVLRACKAVCALDPVVSGKDGRSAAHTYSTAASPVQASSSAVFCALLHILQQRRQDAIERVARHPIHHSPQHRLEFGDIVRVQLQPSVGCCPTGILGVQGGVADGGH